LSEHQDAAHASTLGEQEIAARKSPAVHRTVTGGAAPPAPALGAKAGAPHPPLPRWRNAELLREYNSKHAAVVARWRVLRKCLPELRRSVVTAGWGGIDLFPLSIPLETPEELATNSKAIGECVERIAQTAEHV